MSAKSSLFFVSQDSERDEHRQEPGEDSSIGSLITVRNHSGYKPLGLAARVVEPANQITEEPEA